jgi:hypothetical protein
MKAELRERKPMTYEEGFRDGQAELFRRIHELTYKYKTSEDVIVAIGVMYGKFTLANSTDAATQNQNLNTPKRAIDLEGT